MKGIPVDRLRTALDEADEAKAAKRLMVALAYTDGVHVETIGELLISIDDHLYLDYFENRLTVDALRDEPSPE